MPISTNRLFLLALSLVLSGCDSVPDSPEFTPSSLRGEFLAIGAETEFNSEWWSQFGDPQLNALVQQSLTSNKSLEVAAANVRSAQLIAASQRLDRTPATDTNASLEVGRAARAGQDVNLTSTGGIGASWELDLFGRINAQIAAAEFDVEAALEARRDIAVTVASQTALSYIELRGAERRLEVARQNAGTQREGLELLQTLFDNGRATQLDLERAEAQYRTTLASLPQFEATLQNSLSALAALTGQPANAPDELLLELQGARSDIPEHKGKIVTGSVEDLIRRRPDIRQAEAIIKRQLALGEAARADLFPTLTFNTNILSLFDDTNDVGDLTSFGFAVGPSIRWAGPDLRRIRANININDARSEAALAQYEQTVISALSEVEIALTDYAKELERRNDLVQAARSARSALELARLRFEEGLDDYLDVLEAQRTLLDAEDRLAQSRLEASRRAIFAYRVLGGVGFPTP